MSAAGASAVAARPRALPDAGPAGAESAPVPAAVAGTRPLLPGLRPAGAGSAAGGSSAAAERPRPLACGVLAAGAGSATAVSGRALRGALPVGAGSAVRVRPRALAPVGPGAPTSSASGASSPDCAGTRPRPKPRALGVGRLRVSPGLLTGARLRRRPLALGWFFGRAGSVAGARSLASVSARLPASATLSAGAMPLFASARPLGATELPEPGRLRMRARPADSPNPTTFGSTSLPPALDCFRAGAADLVSNSSVKAIFVSPVTPTSNSAGSCASQWQACLQVLPAPPRCLPGPRVRSRRTSHQRGFGGSGTELRRKWSYRQHSA